MTVVSDAMKLMTAFAPPAIALVLTLAACSSAPDVANNATANVVVPEQEAAAPPPAANATQNVVAVPTPVATKVIGLEGLGDLKIGEAVPKGSSWAERGAQTGDACRTVSSPDYPGVYAIVEGGKVARITVGQRSDVKLVEGIGVGSTEADVKKWFAGFRSEPHKYEEAPAKYLTAPNAASGDPAVRFEIGQDGKVKLLHVGTMPVLGYVEGCG
ncbi:MAG: hypothetical protein ABW184_13935 [Sphingobium sp.]